MRNLVAVNMRDELYTRKPKNGVKFQIGVVDENGDVSILSSKYHQYYNDKSFKKLTKYLLGQNSKFGNFILFEDKKTGQFQALDRRKKLMGLRFKDYMFVEQLTFGYNKISIREKIILESKTTEKPKTQAEDSLNISLDSLTIQDALYEHFTSSNKMLKFLHSSEPFKFKWRSIVIDRGSKVTIQGFIESVGRKFIKALGRNIVGKLSEYGYRFTSLATLEEFRGEYQREKPTGNYDILEEKFFTKDGVQKRKDLQQYNSSLILNYSVL